MPWYGNIVDIPSGFALCDGSNGTPDLRGRTIIGSGAWSDAWGSLIYNLSDSGGERFHQLSIDEMPSHNHVLQFRYESSSQGNATIDGRNVASTSIARSFNTTYTGGNAPHNNMMPYRVLHWIMKV